MLELVLELAVVVSISDAHGESGHNGCDESAVEDDAAEDVPVVGSRGVLPVDSSRVGDVEDVEDDQSDESLFEHSQCYFPEFVSVGGLGDDIEHNTDNQLAEEQDQHDVAVVGEGTGHTKSGEVSGKWSLLFSELDIEAVECPELGQRRQVEYEEILHRESEVRKLQDSEEL